MGLLIVGSHPSAGTAQELDQTANPTAFDVTATGSEAAPLLTGRAQQIRSVVAGTPPTLVIRVVPIPARVGSYPVGTSIVGNRLSAPHGGFRAWFQFQVGDWDPAADGTSPADPAAVQAKINAGGYSNGFGAPLARPLVSCSSDADCTAAFGDTYADCELAVCKDAYVDRFGDEPTAFCSEPQSNCLGACDTQDPNLRCLVAGEWARPDDGTFKSFANMVVDVPVGAKGLYSVSLDNLDTFAIPFGGQFELPSLAETGFEIEIPDGACCNGFTGECSLMAQDECEFWGGRYGGHDSACSAFVPPCAACLDEDKLTASGAGSGDNFGEAVAIDGNTMVVGARRVDCAAGTWCGAAYVYEHNGSVWVQKAKLTASDAAASDYLGHSVAIDGDTVVVGASGDDYPSAESCGSAYVYVKPGGGWVNMTQTAKLTASDQGFSDNFGEAVAIAGNTIAVGAPRDDGAGGNAGAAYVFVKPGGAWANMTQTAKLTASDTTGTDQLGTSVDIDADTVVAGAQMDACSGVVCGSAYVYVKPGGGWANMTQTAKLTSSDAAPSTYLGRSVSISGNTIAVGAPEADCAAGTLCGAAYVYVKAAMGWSTMTQTAKLVLSDHDGEDTLGQSISINGDRIVAGADSRDCPAGPACGSAFLFVKPPGGWVNGTETAELRAFDAAGLDEFGVSVAIDGARIVVGSYFDDCPAGSNCGAAYAYRIPRIIYVNDDAAGLDNGTSWADAFPNLQDALSDALPCDSIWVAAGTYRPDQGGGQTPGSRTATFQLLNGVAIYGGFAGGETMLSQRNVAANATILSGDLSGDDGPVACAQDSPDCDSHGAICGDDGFCIISSNNADNSYHVVTGSSADATAVLDGLTITGGNANGGFPDDHGGGMYNNGGAPAVTNCTFHRNYAGYGGGMGNLSSYPVVTNCLFSMNFATGSGGGMRSGFGGPTLTGCTFIHNRASAGGGMAGGTSSVTATNCTFSGNDADRGGGTEIQNSNPTFTNCKYSGNAAVLSGGAMSNAGAHPIVINCTFAGNTAESTVGGIYNWANGDVSVTNSVLWGNVSDVDGGSGGPFTDEAAQIQGGLPVVNYSIVQGGWSGAGSNNLNVDPLFVDADGADDMVGTEDDDLRPLAGSPAIDAADSSVLSPDTADLDKDGDTGEAVSLDLAGNPRQLDDLLTPDTGVEPSPIVDMGAYEFVPDCNNNGVPDFVDVLNPDLDSNQDGIPDDCGGFTDNCNPPSDNWSCFDNWNLPGDQYPDDVASAPGVHVILDEPDDVLLDVNATIPSLRIQRNATLRVTQAGLGDLTILTEAVVGGSLRALNDRVIRVEDRLEFTADGYYESDSGTSDCDDPVEPDCGSAYGYRFSAGNWIQSPPLTLSDGVGNERFGDDVSVDGDVAVVGAQLDHLDMSPDIGSAHVYEFNGAFWGHVAELTNSDAFGVLGVSVAISDDVIVVGDSGNHAMFVFRKPPAGWTNTTETDKLTGGDTSPGDSFAHSVAVSGNVAIAGAPHDDCASGAVDCGSAYVFRTNDGGTTWFQDAKLIALDASEKDGFGWSVSISGGVAAVGASQDDCSNGDADCGAAYIFRYNGSNWVQQGKLTASDAAARDYFAASLAIDGDVVVVGAARAGLAGAAYVFLKPAGGWMDSTQTAKLTATDARSLGNSVAVSGDRIVVADISAGCSAQSPCGRAYVFDKPGGGWANMTETAKLSASDQAARDDFGSSVSVSGDKVIVGAPRNDCGVGFVDVVCSSLQVNGTLEVSAGSAEDATSGGSMDLTSHMSVAAAHLSYHGLPAPDWPLATAGVTPPPKFKLSDSATATIATAFALSGAVESTNTSVFGAYLAGEWDNQSIAPSLFDWVAGRLILEGAVPQTFEVAGIDLGPTPEGFATNADALFDTAPHTNFAIGALEVADSRQVVFRNSFANTVAASPCAEAMYVRALTLRPGAQVTLDNVRVYGQLLMDEGAVITRIGCGDIILVPQPPNITWNPSAQQTRSITFNAQDPSTATGASGTSAIKVTMMHLENPTPANNNPAGPCCPPGNFITFDTAVNSVCAGGNDQGYRCPPSTCPGSTCPAGVGCTEAAGANAQGSCARWVGPPLGYLESNDNPGLGNYRAARLQCTPYYHDWASEPDAGLVNVQGAEIVPSSSYELQAYGSSCKGAENACTNVSAAVVMFTRRAGDIATPFQTPSPPLTQPNAVDVSNAVNKFRNLAGAPPKVIAQVQPNFPDPNSDINAIDIVTVVDNVRGFGYTYSGPCVCPSTVPCNVTACAGASACTGLYGAGATCIKTCSSGPRLGQPCNNNLNCGACVGGPLTGNGAAGIPCDANTDCASNNCGVGTCPTGATPGFCRDRCGRCN
jgi:hypothetical protein